MSSWALSNGYRGYSFGWWPKTEIYGQGAYAAAGWGGQEIVILPKYDMVVVFTGGSYWVAPLMTPHEMMVGYILPSIM
jgi:CubicO group peptidase (beta-lactamase class C family)